MSDIHVAPFTILIDQQEKNPLTFENLTTRKGKKDYPVVVKTEVCHLKTGDYSIKEHKDKIAIERKSSKDLIGTISRHRKRFERELDRLNEMDFACVLVERDWKEVLLDCQLESNYNPASLDASILAFMMRYPNVHWIFRNNRYSAAKTAFKIFDIYLRRIKNDG